MLLLIGPNFGKKLFRFLFPILQLSLHNSITVTSCIFKSWPVQNCDATPGVGNQSSLLQNASGDGHACTTYSQHLPQKFLGRRKFLGSNPGSSGSTLPAVLPLHAIDCKLRFA